jgi:hypothetical protein
VVERRRGTEEHAVLENKGLDAVEALCATALVKKDTAGMDCRLGSAGVHCL